jgi:tRNA1(Val) A37 N6-methylase TrmN6
MEPNILGFDWASIEHVGTVVDVGGGLGAPSMVLARTFPDLKIIIQDRPAVISQGLAVGTYRMIRGPFNLIE